MLLRLTILAVFVIAFSCQQYNRTQWVIIGNVANIPTKKVYLSQANNIREFLDSAEYKNGQFKFKLDPRKFSEPFLASISIINEKNKIEPLLFINYKTSTKTDTFSNSGCFLETPTTSVTGDFKERLHRVNVEAGRENDLFFDPSYSSFGYIENKNRNESLDTIKQTILKQSDSYFLLSMLFEARSHYTKKEIDDLIVLFDYEIQHSPRAFKLRSYADNLLVGTTLPNIKVLNEKFQAENLLDTASKLTMIIFWASWCGPCRIEIPQLKEIYQKYSSQGLNMVSLSTDKNSDKWLSAVKQERMMWRQCIIDSSDLEKTNAQFGIYAIPLVIFINKDHKELKRFVGFYDSNISEYSKVIDKSLTTYQ